MRKAKSHPKTRFDIFAKIWQGWEAGNQTFTDEELEKVDVREIQALLNESTAEAPLSPDD